jgi:hypothetical protein
MIGRVIVATSARRLDRLTTKLWIALGVGIAVALRAPWHDAPLGRD